MSPTVKDYSSHCQTFSKKLILRCMQDISDTQIIRLNQIKSIVDLVRLLQLERRRITLSS